MTEILVGVSPRSSKDPAEPPSAEELAAAKELVRQARAQGVGLTGPSGLLKALTKTVLETAFEEEMAEHLGYVRYERADSSDVKLSVLLRNFGPYLHCRPGSSW